MDEPKDIIKNQLECSILNAELDLKLFRKRLLMTKDDQIEKALMSQIEQVEGGLELIKEKLKILTMEK